MLPGPAVLRNGEETLEDEHRLSEHTIGVRVRRAREIDSLRMSPLGHGAQLFSRLPFCLPER